MEALQRARKRRVWTLLLSRPILQPGVRTFYKRRSNWICRRTGGWPPSPAGQCNACALRVGGEEKRVRLFSRFFSTKSTRMAPTSRKLNKRGDENDSTGLYLSRSRKFHPLVRPPPPT